MYNVSIGPIDYDVGRKALKRVLDASPLIITRDDQTKELLDSLNLSYQELHKHADCALNTVPTSGQALQKIIFDEKLFTNPKGTIGFNVNAYIDNWSMKGTHSQGDFCQTIAEAVDKVIESLDVDIIFFVTQIMDLENTNRCINLTKHKNRILIISNKTYTYEDITGLLKKVKLHVGLRTHTLIFCASVGTPMINISSYPKSRGFMQTIGQEDKFISFENLNPDYIAQKVQEVWERREQISGELTAIIGTEKEKARSTANYLEKYLR